MHHILLCGDESTAHESMAAEKLPSSWIENNEHEQAESNAVSQKLGENRHYKLHLHLYAVKT